MIRQDKKTNKIKIDKKEAGLNKFLGSKKTIFKILSLILLIGLNLSFLTTIKDTVAFFNDIEKSKNNNWKAATLNFSLSTPDDFTPLLTADISVQKQILMSNQGILGFDYSIKTDNFSGLLCSAIKIKAKLNGEEVYEHNLIGFNYSIFDFASFANWQFIAQLDDFNESYQKESCSFDFIYESLKDNGIGFFDIETISNVINSGSWAINEPEDPGDESETSTPAHCVKINEVYYNPDSSHGSAEDEWIEIYNACSESMNLKNWSLRDNHTLKTINQNYIILPNQFLVIAANASAWSYWPLIPKNALKIAVGGARLFNGLNNDGDRVFLFDNFGNQIDEVSWGNDSSAFSPSVANVAQGHSIARKVKGADTDTADDWEDLLTPNPGTNPHSFLATANSLVEKITELFETPEETESPISTSEDQKSQPIQESPVNNENPNLNSVFLSLKNPFIQETEQENLAPEPEIQPEIPPEPQTQPKPEQKAPPQPENQLPSQLPTE